LITSKLARVSRLKSA